MNKSGQKQRFEQFDDDEGEGFFEEEEVKGSEAMESPEMAEVVSPKEESPEAFDSLPEPVQMSYREERVSTQSPAKSDFKPSPEKVTPSPYREEESPMVEDSKPLVQSHV